MDIKHSFILAVLGLVLVACKEPETEAVFSLQQETLSIEWAGGRFTIPFETTGDWEAHTTASWCSIAPSSGSVSVLKDHVIYLTCDENWDESRSCHLIINSNGEEKKVLVSQEDAPLLLPRTVFVLSHDSQLLGIPFISDEPVTAEFDSSGKDWLNVAETGNPSAKDTLWLSIGENRSGKRSASVAISCSQMTKSIQINQDAQLVPITDPHFLDFCQVYLDFNRDGQFCMDDADKVTTINYQNFRSYDYTNLKNVQGWEYFHNLQSIHAESSYLTHFEFSRYKDLENVYFHAPFLDPDFSSNKKLRTVALRNCFGTINLENLENLSSVEMLDCACEFNLEGSTNLTSFVANLPLYETLDLGFQEKLARLGLSGCDALKTIETSKMPSLSHVTIIANKSIEVLDLSYQYNLQYLVCKENPNLKVIYVRNRRPVTCDFDWGQVKMIVVE